ncbi:Gfo/Idh/MocA family protein [Youngiibacter multivorans]|uniref:Dehydrogenase n=1 Tax=Youngiibacter multivorans TaxID=937251 RepID=A0ABS4G527_9CLOT|nr:Gfo/Idh/MocA family oxidoreductase [Youngiibacter multivorans]MBP1919663.1 putative dehydrogenase [Youngiibacter multivorans]
MVRFGIIGTSMITELFIYGAQKVSGFRLSAIYSRDIDRAKAFGSKFGDDILYFNDLEEFSLSSEFDAVYIASPNSLHAPQSMLMISHGKHVLCEKPAVSNSRELEEVIGLARSKNLLYMEAMKSLTMPAYLNLQELLPRIGKVRKYIGNYCQYSSRYDRHKNGEYVNTFRKEFSNGSLLDIGIYCLYPAVHMFGKPLRISANGVILEDGGVDGTGSILMKYAEMEAVITHSKISNSKMPSEIQGELGNILIDKIGSPEKITLILRDGTVEEHIPDQVNHNMMYEAQEFISLIEEGTFESGINSYSLALDVHNILDEARSQIGLTYPADI